MRLLTRFRLSKAAAHEVANRLLKVKLELIVEVASYLRSSHPEAEQPANALGKSHAQTPSSESRTLKTASAYRAQSPDAFASSARPALVRL